MKQLFENMISQSRAIRFKGFLIDAALIAVILIACMFIFGQPDFIGTYSLIKSVEGMGGTKADYDQRMLEISQSFNRTYITTLIICFFYEWFCWTLCKGRSVGKILTKQQILIEKNPERKLLTNLKYTWRALLKLAFALFFQGIPFLVSMLMIFSDPENRALHDRLSGTMVTVATNDNEANID